MVKTIKTQPKKVMLTHLVKEHYLTNLLPGNYFFTRNFSLKELYVIANGPALEIRQWDAAKRGYYLQY